MDAADINRSIFNEEAASYDHKHRKLNERLTRELQARLDFIGVDWASDDEDTGDEFEEGGANRPRREVRMLDYACGTGMMSRAIAPYTTQCVGMDVSEKMVAAYNARAENQGLLKREMHAIVGDLTAPTVSQDLMSSDLFDFDIAVVGGGLHHFADPELAAKRHTTKTIIDLTTITMAIVPAPTTGAGHVVIVPGQVVESTRQSNSRAAEVVVEESAQDGSATKTATETATTTAGATLVDPVTGTETKVTRTDGRFSKLQTERRDGGGQVIPVSSVAVLVPAAAPAPAPQVHILSPPLPPPPPHVYHQHQQQQHVQHSVMHHGFTPERVREIFTAAGAGQDFVLEVIGGGFALGPSHGHGHGHGHGHEHRQEGTEREKGEGEEYSLKESDQDEHVAREGLRRQVFFARGTKGKV
ncbi:hypothetical protein F5Y17DRAFT_474871 [Xylariaceae sp. FL0594]|nr:hypothetical protein F5Y17DRAFT_474871 [Xylariaceae sp. FL0594]